MNSHKNKDPVWSEFTRSIKRLPNKPSKPVLTSKNNKKEPERTRTASNKIHLFPEGKSQTATAPKTQPALQEQVLMPNASIQFTRTMERKLRTGDIRIDAKLDLHGMTQEQAHAALTHFIASTIKTNKRTLLIITGKGQGLGGILRNNLRQWLAASQYAERILSIRQAAPAHGSEGACYVILRKSPC